MYRNIIKQAYYLLCIRKCTKESLGFCPGKVALLVSHGTLYVQDNEESSIKGKVVIMLSDHAQRDLTCRYGITWKSCTPITANMNCRMYVTSIMLPMVLTAMMTHFTTDWDGENTDVS